MGSSETEDPTRFRTLGGTGPQEPVSAPPRQASRLTVGRLTVGFQVLTGDGEDGNKHRPAKGLGGHSAPGKDGLRVPTWAPWSEKPSWLGL